MIYYKTIFYNNVYDTTKFIVLSNTATKCIGEAEKGRGYIAREDLMLFYDCPIKQEDIGEHSYVVEYMTTALDGVEKIEILRLKVVV